MLDKLDLKYTYVILWNILFYCSYYVISSSLKRVPCFNIFLSAQAGELTLVDQKKLEEEKAAYGASLAELKKLDGFEAWLEEVRKKKAAKRDFLLSMMNREKNVYMYM